MSHELADDLVAVIVVGLAMLVPIIAVMLKHQREMAMIYREGQTNPQSDEKVLRELAQLRELVVQQSLAIENLRTERTLPPPVDSVQNRLGV